MSFKSQKTTGKCCTIKSLRFSSKRESHILQQTFKMNSILTAAEIWDLKGSTLEVKQRHLARYVAHPEAVSGVRGA